MDQVTSTPNNNQPQPQSKHAKKWLRNALIAVAVIVVAAGLGLATQYIIGRHQVQKSKVTGLPKVVDDIQNLRLKGDTKEADKKLNQALADPTISDTVKQQLYVQKGYSATQAGDFQAAADAFSKAVAIHPDPDIYRMLGESYFQQGKKADARAAYVKALDLIKSSGGSTGGGGLANDLQQRIDIIDGKIDPTKV
jgi:tetratricopeptide (TPR) repeat protein